MVSEKVFGGTSKVIASVDGSCIDYTYINELSGVGPIEELNFTLMDNQVSVVFGTYDIADRFIITPLYDYYVATINNLLVEEGARATIRVCQYLMS